ncbi:unnamed protein product [Urochloa decumbens]|uniref:DUF4220 domain-containing protein n=1 Tax=Urochloa decumbens TaxID=240449 RepID=A0ABC8VZ28_9POAL
MAAQLAVVHLWKEWGLHVLVLLSFTLQVTLLVLAELRRRIDSGVLRAFVWSAYMLADSVAIYAIGHLSVTSQAAEHQVMALWAPLLLVHLGGQDNITAYALEDNRLWLRHLQTLAVQATGAAYVLYVSLLQEPVIAGGGTGGRRRLGWLRSAAALLLVVGVAKYGERVWALIHANCSPSRIAGSFYRIRCGSKELSERDTEGLWQFAYATLADARDLFQIPRPAVVDVRLHYQAEMRGDVMCKVAEMQLSLMHDVLFSKAEVMHTWPGLCARAFCWVATAVALSLFHLHQVGAQHEQGSRKDAAVTYVLLAGAVILETVSGLRGMVSTWTWWPLVHTTTSSWLISDGGGRVADALRRCICAGDYCLLPRGWSGSMGQLNLFHMCSSAAAASPIITLVGVEEWWNTFAYSGSARASPHIKDLLVRQVVRSVGIPKESPNHIRNSRGRAALERCGADEVVLLESVVGLEFEHSIIAWHVATYGYLCWYRMSRRSSTTHQQQEDDLARAVQALSNYMFFLLAARPYMLPTPATASRRTNYAGLCYKLIRVQGSQYVCSAEVLVRALALPDKFGNLTIHPVGQDDASRMSRLRRHMSSDYWVSNGSKLCGCLIDKELLQVRHAWCCSCCWQWHDARPHRASVVGDAVLRQCSLQRALACHTA